MTMTMSDPLPVEGRHRADRPDPIVDAREESWVLDAETIAEALPQRAGLSDWTLNWGGREISPATSYEYPVEPLASASTMPAYALGVGFDEYADKRAHPTVEFVALVVNIENAHSSPLLADHIRRDDPDMVFMLQAYYAHDWLEDINHYRLRQRHTREGRGIACLFRDDLTIARRHPLLMDEPWHGPPSKGGRLHPPRELPSYRVEKDNAFCRTLVVHGPTSNNPVAQAEMLDEVGDWFNRRPEAPSFAPGDYNRRLRQLAAAARAAGADVASARTKVDHAMYRNMQVKAERLRPAAKGTHGWQRYTLKVPVSS